MCVCMCKAVVQLNIHDDDEIVSEIRVFVI